MPFGPANPMDALSQATTPAAAVAAVGKLAMRHVGGFTGDVLGAAQQMAEALVLAGLAMAFSHGFP
ncbi:MAG: adenosylcobinamide-GDP ribazoletransferase [Alphaproteobacteria bacterium]|nr:adenosylcobinamide-GDP ribazoletransferase [Alphaproteobacteria bacterium]